MTSIPRFKLTGKEISTELLEILRRLEVGKYVPIEDIENTPEIKLARSCINNSISTDKLSDREDLREYIVEKLQEMGSASIDDKGRTVYNNAIDKDSRLDIVIGLPASGKSSAIVDVISQEFHSRIIDNDEAKKLIPEYNNGWGAGVVHKESQRISEWQLHLALLNHENIVLPKVGSDPNKLNTIIQRAKQLGYEINLHYVELDRGKALGRMLNRFIEEGRFLDPKLIDKYDNNLDGNKVEKSYEILKKGGNINGYSKWNNDVSRGEKPILIEAECRGAFIRNARTSVDIIYKLPDDGRRSSRGSGCISEYVGKSGSVEGPEHQRGAKENMGNSRKDGEELKEHVRPSLLAKLADYKNKAAHQQQGQISENRSKNIINTKNIER